MRQACALPSLTAALSAYHPCRIVYSVVFLVVLGVDLGEDVVDVEVLGKGLGHLHCVVGGEASGGDSLGEHVAELVLGVGVNVVDPFEAGVANLGKTAEDLIGVLGVELIVEVQSDLTDLGEGAPCGVDELGVNLGKDVSAIIVDLLSPLEDLVL